MKIESKLKRILLMIVIGVVLALIQLAIGMRPSGAYFNLIPPTG